MKVVSIAITAALLVSPLATSAKEREAIKVTGPKNAAGLADIVVGSFSVAFIQQKTDAAFAGSKSQFKAMGSIVKSTLAGIDPAEFQAITDAVYADFATRMASAGYRLQDRTVLIADKQMAKVRYLPSVAEGTVQFGKDAKAKQVFHIDITGATDVGNVEVLSAKDLPKSITPVKKKLFLDLLDRKHGIQDADMPEKFEGLAFGPDLADGRRLLLVTADNDFIQTKPFRVYAFAIDPADLPKYTPQVFGKK